MRAIAILLRRAKRIYETEGLESLVSRALAFVAKRVLDHQTYYLTVRTLDGAQAGNEAAPTPQVDGLALKMITTNDQADELEADGYEFRSYPYFVNGGKALNAGAIAFCLFVKRELAAIGWVALSQQAMDSLNEPPIKLDFAGGESFVGSVWTSPKYRRMGFRRYRSFRIRQFLRDQGTVAILGYTTEKDAAAATRIATEAGRTIYARARYVRVLWWESWNETPLSASSSSTRSHEVTP